jgi:hypothetical protein
MRIDILGSSVIGQRFKIENLKKCRIIKYFSPLTSSFQHVVRMCGPSCLSRTSRRLLPSVVVNVWLAVSVLCLYAPMYHCLTIVAKVVLLLSLIPHVSVTNFRTPFSFRTLLGNIVAGLRGEWTCC